MFISQQFFTKMRLTDLSVSFSKNSLSQMRDLAVLFEFLVFLKEIDIKKETAINKFLNALTNSSRTWPKKVIS